MCGIAGLLTPNEIDLSALGAMSGIARHRGPDDEGFLLCSGSSVECFGGPHTPDSAFRAQVPWRPQSALPHEKRSGGFTAFAHRRLAILDLSPNGHQPMSYGDGRYWICFNGEIYNYLELKAELATKHQFLTTSDTEVILAAFHEWGENCLERFRGMWAFAIFDSHRQTLFLARDRFGIKPLYYWIAPDGTFAFASEIKQLTVLPGWSARINAQRAFDYLAFGMTDHTDECLFDGVYQLPAGHHATLSAPDCRAQRKSDGRILTERWYAVRPETARLSEADAAAEFKRRFFDSVALHLRADVPIGSCLSGGLDSSAIVCAMNELLSAQGAQHLQKTFSAGSSIAKYDERKWINSVIEKTGVTPYFVEPSLDELWNSLPNIVYHQDEPIGSTSPFAQWKVF